MKPDPVELWLRDLHLSSKTKRNIKDILTILWTFGMKKEFVSLGRNPMDLVTIRKQKGEKKRLPMKDLTGEQFQALLKALESNSRVTDHGDRHAQLRTTNLGDTWLAMEGC
jgi:hypothetical protein